MNFVFDERPPGPLLSETITPIDFKDNFCENDAAPLLTERIQSIALFALELELLGVKTLENTRMVFGDGYLDIGSRESRLKRLAARELNEIHGSLPKANRTLVDIRNRLYEKICDSRAGMAA